MRSAARRLRRTRRTAGAGSRAGSPWICGTTSPGTCSPPATSSSFGMPERSPCYRSPSARASTSTCSPASLPRPRPGRRGRGGHRGDREPARALRQIGARRAARARRPRSPSWSKSPSRRWSPRGEGFGVTIAAVGKRVALQRPRPLRGRAGGGRQASEHFDDLSVVDVGASRADRGGRPKQERRARCRGARATLGDDPRQRHRLGTRNRGALASASQRERGRRHALPRSDRAAWPHPACGVELARAHLLYGEWLRRERRRIDAREELRTAHELFADDGRRGVRRARRAASCSPPARRRASAPRDTRDQLTAQEAQIARLARDGHSNPEIGAQLFISPRTVEYHLHKVFTKLEISSRNELRRVLRSEAREAQPV